MIGRGRASADVNGATLPALGGLLTKCLAPVQQAPDGLTLAEVQDLIAAVGRRLEIAAAALTAYDPDQDLDDRAARAAEALAVAVVATLLPDWP